MTRKTANEKPKQRIKDFEKKIIENERTEKEMGVVTEIGRIINSTLDIDEVYERFAIEARKLILFDRLSVSLQAHQEGNMVVAYVTGMDLPGRRKGDTHPLAGSMIEVLMHNRTGFIFHPKGVEEVAVRYPSLVNSYKAGLKSTITIPLISHDKIIGSLGFGSKKPNAYAPIDLDLAERIGNQIAGAIANAQVHADLKNTEKSRRESEALLRALFEQAAVGMAEVDINTGRYLLVNRRHCEIFGMTEEEMLATTFADVTHREDCLLHGEKLAQLISGKLDTLTMEERCIRKDGATIWLNVAATLLLNPGGEPEKEIIVIEDITGRKHLELELRKTLDILESRVMERTYELEETNTALRVLLQKRENDRQELAESIQTNIEQLVMPALKKLRASSSAKEKNACLNILEANLLNIVSPFLNHLASSYKNLTPREIQIAELVKQGKTSKEIAEFLGLSVGTVVVHRHNMRRKLKFKSKDVNLRSHLLLLNTTYHRDE
ncbi:MAG: PAS domain S-box protein [Syntrophaceae bacterium]|nr:PAS domain S-box protein [Syntrophaceae bacterium]